MECAGGWGASWGGPPGAAPQPVPQKPGVWCVFGVCVCLLLVGFVRGKGGLVSSARTSGLLFCIVLSVVLSL